MKCLVIACEYPPMVGGIGNAAESFSEQMTNRGWEIEVCTVASPPLPAEGMIGHCLVHRLALKGTVSLWEPLKGDITSFERILDRFTPDVVVIHGWPGWCVLLLPRIFVRGIPVILQSHGFGVHRVPWHARPPFGLKAWAGHLPFIWQLPGLIRKMHALVVLSNESDFLLSFDHWLGEKTGCPNVVTIPNAVTEVTGEPNRFLQICPPAAGKRVILNVANFCDRKNQRLAIDVLSRLPDPDLLMVFIGGMENDYSRALEQVIAERNLKDRAVVLCGVERSVTEAAIAGCEIALMTSKWEMQPLFLLEAMSARKPWVSTNVGSVRELKGGLICPPHPESLAAALGSLLANPQLVDQQASEGRSLWSRDFRPDIVYEKWLALLQESVKTRINQAPATCNR